MLPPRCTYRLQLHAGFTFADAAAAVPYLAALGVSHLYLSTVLQAVAGSTHGYDVVDPERAATQLGGDEGFAALVRTVREAGLGILLDIVPNHMSIAGTGNAWWLDVLENGAASYYAHFFDVDWQGDERVLMPVLGERYGRALTTGQLGVVHDGAGHVVIRAGTQRFPIAPRSLGPIVRRAGRADRARGARVSLSATEAQRCSPRPTERDADLRRRRHRDKAVLTRRLAELCASDAACARAIDAEVAQLAADPIELDIVLEAQNYRLAHWSVSGSHLSYRRFFDINTLVGVRTEDADVFAAGHHRIIGWLADGSIDGVRVDHVDGLRDPDGLPARLRALATPSGEPPWIVVEKILAAGESIPAAWRIDGTHRLRRGGAPGPRCRSIRRARRALTRGVRARDETSRGIPRRLAAARRGSRCCPMRCTASSRDSSRSRRRARAASLERVATSRARQDRSARSRRSSRGYPVYRTYLGGDAAETELDDSRIATAMAAVPSEIDRTAPPFGGAAGRGQAPPVDRDLAVPGRCARVRARRFDARERSRTARNS